MAYERSRNIRRNMASVAEIKRSFFAEIDKVENREMLEKKVTKPGKKPYKSSSTKKVPTTAIKQILKAKMSEAKRAIK